MKRLTPVIIPLFFLVTAGFLFARMPEALESVRLKYFDTLMRWEPRAYQDLPVRIIDIDDATLQKFGQWPWPRSLTARLVDRLREEKVSVIAFDVLFAEPDRTSPANLAALWSGQTNSDTLEKILTELPDHDHLLAEAIGKTKAVTAFTLSSRNTGGTPALKSGFSFAGDDPRMYLPDFPGTVTTLPELENAAAGNGIITYLAEYDGTVRGVPLVYQLRGSLYPALVMEAVRIHIGTRNYSLQSTASSGEIQMGEHAGLLRVKVGKTIIPTDPTGRLRLYDSGYIAPRTVPAWQVLENKIPLGGLEGKIVFIGTSAAGLKDIRATPLNPAAAGVEVHAQLAEQILSGVYLYRPDWAEGAEFTFFLAVGLLMIIFMGRLGAAGSAVLGALSVAAFYGFSLYGFHHLRWLVDPTLPSIASLVIYTVSSLIHFLRTDREKQQIRSAFGRYLAPSLVKELAQHPDRLKLGGEMKVMSVLFADIRNFTALAERMKPEELTVFLNRFLTPMTSTILQHNGTIDKYMGDCVMAFWNAPVEDPEHAFHACLTALEMQKALVGLNKNQEPVNMGIGINTGSCCVGNLGSDQRFDYSVIGDTVNIASRLEGLSRLYGVNILAGPETFALTGHLFFFLEADQVRVKGRQGSVRVYTLIGKIEEFDAALRQSWSEQHSEMLSAYRSREWDKAERAAQACLKTGGSALSLAPLYQFYLEKIEAFRKEPPAAGWEGITVASAK